MSRLGFLVFPLKNIPKHGYYFLCLSGNLIKPPLITNTKTPKIKEETHKARNVDAQLCW